MFSQVKRIFQVGPSIKYYPNVPKYYGHPNVPKYYAPNVPKYYD